MLIQLNYENKEKKSFDNHGFCSLAVVSWERGIVCVAGGDSRSAPCTGSFLVITPEADIITSSFLQHHLGVECQGFLGLVPIGNCQCGTLKLRSGSLPPSSNHMLYGIICREMSIYPK